MPLSPGYVGVGGASPATLPLPPALPAATEGELRQSIAVALASWNLPQAVHSYHALRPQLGRDDPILLREIAWRLLEAAVERGDDWSLAERREAVGALGPAGDPAVVDWLVRLLSHSAWELRWTALEAVGAYGTPEAAAALMRGASDADRRVRCAAGGLLLERQDPRGFKPALECGTPPELRYRALRLLLEQAAEAPAEVLGLVSHHEALEPRLALAVVLVRRARPEERPLLVALERDSKPLIKRAARCGLAILDAPAGQPGPALKLFRSMLAGSPEQRATALFLLGLLGQRLGEQAVELLANQLRPDDPESAGAVCVAFSHLGLPAAIPHLIRVLRSPDFPVDVQRKAAMALGRLSDPRSVTTLRGLLVPGQAPPPVQQIAISALAALEDAGAVPLITPLTRHPDPGLVATAATALASLPAPSSQPTLLELLDHGDPYIRSKAALGLGKLADRTALPRLADRLADPDRGVQYNTAAAIVRLTSNPPDLLKK